MPEIELPFSLNEYAKRLNLVRSAMDEAGIDVLFVADPSNMAWLTGYDGWSFYVQQGVLVGPDGEPVFWGRAMDAIGASKTCYMGAENLIGYPDNYVMSMERHPMQHLASVISERGWAGLRIGVEMENYYYSAKSHAVLEEGLATKLHDATALINWQRAVKSETELAFMQRAGLIVDRMHERIFEVFEKGVPKNRVVAEIYHAGITGAEGEGIAFGGDYPAIAPLLPTGTQAEAPHLTWDDKPVAGDSGTFFEIAGCYRRYHVPTARTIWLGDPPKDIRKAEEAVLEGMEAGLAAAVPGNTAGDVARAYFSVLSKYGIEREGRCGYPVGISYPPDWGERTFSIRPEDETELKENMTFHFMTGLWTPDWGLEITETLRVRGSGPATPFSQTPRKLFVKG